MMKIYTRNIVLVLLVSASALYKAQEVDLENLGKKTKEELKKNPFKISGGISANSVFYSSNVYRGREPFTYFLNGNLNLGLYKWSMPISYSLTNQGSQLGYQVPFKFNRISIAPKYKWVKAYMGDANMTFSPYTFNGLLFTGGGLELTPKIPLKVALMTGRLNKAVEDDGNPNTIPAYKRMGYGAHLKWEKDKYKLGLIGFYAKDNVGSLKNALDDKGVLPQENLVLSMAGNFKLDKNIEVYGEYANTAVINDLRATENGAVKKGISSKFLSPNSSMENYSAFNTGIDLKLKKGMIGIKYEKIDPGYKTLGAYYFNNDLENITLNSSFTMLKDKLSLSTNIGRQRDNLDNKKAKQTSRWVGAVNANLKASDKLMITASYSNFTMFTSRQLNQFNTINDNPLIIQQPKDSIDYKQISQNTNININYILSSTKEKVQNINFNYSLNDMANRENGIVRRGGLSRFHNANLNYNLGLPDKKMNIAASFNFTHTFAASQVSKIWGPGVNITKSFLKEEKLKASVGVSYNHSASTTANINVMNFRLGAIYMPWKKHNFNLNFIQMFRNTDQAIENPKLNEMTCTVGYNYSL
ncbi:TonB-dependent receptor [Chryseobacterium indoltheticum]|uniref:Outer membrane protein beta-barrel domain-containing protein n=1 Tax=Chryseobacterium indoltheticum TaxID=254 RepID=A0A381F4I8_9FLAO|nr:hypothetical protein [Chryseobacterium indoltheticum]SIQ29879.1 hypothetical protein SAMN05421682_10421 [Chryseobacterium indoltheticum]SUX41383.1 Uncharacterised protein [Chryseobacterium indoltheticum]